MYTFKNDEERKAALFDNKFSLYKKTILEGIFPVAFMSVLQLLYYKGDISYNSNKDIGEAILGLALLELMFLVDAKEVKERKEEIYKMLGYSISPDLYPYGYTNYYSEKEVKQLVRK